MNAEVQPLSQKQHERITVIRELFNDDIHRAIYDFMGACKQVEAFTVPPGQRLTTAQVEERYQAVLTFAHTCARIGRSLPPSIPI